MLATLLLIYCLECISNSAARQLFVYTKNSNRKYYVICGVGAKLSLVKYRLPNWIKIIGFTPSLALRLNTRIFSLFDEWM